MWEVLVGSKSISNPSLGLSLTPTQDLRGYWKGLFTSLDQSLGGITELWGLCCGNRPHDWPRPDLYPLIVQDVQHSWQATRGKFSMNAILCVYVKWHCNSECIRLHQCASWCIQCISIQGLAEQQQWQGPSSFVFQGWNYARWWCQWCWSVWWVFSSVYLPRAYSDACPKNVTCTLPRIVFCASRSSRRSTRLGCKLWCV